MEMKNIYEIWDKFENSVADEIELDMNGVHIKLKKNSNHFPVNNVDLMNLSNTLVTKDNNTDNQDNKEVDNSDLNEVKAPLVGTFYSSPGPNEEPFIKVGQSVKKGDVIGIVEAMKLMNELVAPCDGIVEKILVEDGNMVEFDQVLVLLK